MVASTIIYFTSNKKQKKRKFQLSKVTNIGTAEGKTLTQLTKSEFAFKVIMQK